MCISSAPAATHLHSHTPSHTVSHIYEGHHRISETNQQLETYKCPIHLCSLSSTAVCLPLVLSDVVLLEALNNICPATLQSHCVPDLQSPNTHAHTDTGLTKPGKNISRSYFIQNQSTITLMWNKISTQVLNKWTFVWIHIFVLCRVRNGQHCFCPFHSLSEAFVES